MRLNLKMKFLIPTLAATVLCLVVISLVSYLKSRDALETTIRSQINFVSNAINRQVGVWLSEREQDLTAFSHEAVFEAAVTEPAESLLSKKANQRFITITRGTPLFELLGLAGADGTISSSSLAGMPGKVNIKDRGYFKSSMAGRVAISPVIKSRVSGNPVFVISVPLRQNNEIKGILFGAVKLDEFSKAFIDSVKVGKTGYVYMTGPAGKVLAYPDKSKILSLDISEFDFGRQMLDQKSGTIHYEYAGIDKIVSFSQAERTGWIIASTANTDEIFAPVRKIRNTNLIIAAVGILAVALIIFLVTQSVVSPVNRIIAGMKEGADQVASAAGQVSSTSQSMAEGATQQAAAIEETSSSMEEMAAMTRKNAENSNTANTLMSDANTVVSRANRSMKELTQSMEEITQASEETSKIIKTIDEIAFQTNLLALNAAVEAARAGEAGAGFAVVADEVRNLALRAADAAKDTAAMIEGTVKKVNDGSGLVSATGDAFHQVAGSTQKVGELLDEISQASGEQSEGIGQVNSSISEMDRVVQQNASSAEESASASEEMNAQAEQLRDYVDELVVIVTGNAGKAEAGAPGPKPARKTSAQNRTMDQKQLAKANEVRPDQVIPFDEEDKF